MIGRSYSDMSRETRSVLPQTLATAASMLKRRCLAHSELLWQMFRALGAPRKQARFLMLQLSTLALQPLLIIALAGLFIGGVLVLHAHGVLAKYHALDQLGPLIALSLIRELGPVVSTILFAGSGGAAITSAIALMQATEQLEALDAMAIDPIDHVVAPRFWAAFLLSPILIVLFLAAAFLGAAYVTNVWVDLPINRFWESIHMNISWAEELPPLLLKTAGFSFIVAHLSCTRGYFASPSPEGMTKSVTQTVVLSSISTLGFDFLLTGLLF